MSLRFALRLLFVGMFALALAVACGRASIDDYPLSDGGPATCNLSTCPNGCCDSSGVCRVGSDSKACGNFGARCLDCAAGGGTCSEDKKECGIVVGSCDATTCANGCCSKTADGRAICLTGSANTACGVGGQACVDCGLGRSCQASTHQCVAGGCGPGNCDGCCVGNQCQKGLDAKLCGSEGLLCSNCEAFGQKCAGFSGKAGGHCEGTPTCGPANCKGCCTAQGQCVGGVDQTACGLGGQLCKACAGTDACTAGACVPQGKCGPNNCTGNSCCFGDECVPGTQDTACGASGAACQNCTGQGLTCGAGGKCVQPACSAATCPTGCCQGNVCVTGTQDDACGKGGQACSNCTQNGRVCGAGNTCQVPCTPQNCGGCCDGTTCRGGFTNTRCGSGGKACSDCSAQGQTCDPNQRSCIAPNVCPEAYAGCPAGATTVPPVPQPGACSAQNLQDAAAGCAQGANSGACNAFFAFLAQNAPACDACLSPFRVPFNQGTGIYLCAAPFAGDPCNHNTGCVADCVTDSCDQCGGDAAIAQCQQQVRGGQCAQFNAPAAQCIAQVLGGAASFCSPASYPNQGRFGRWLEGVGTNYCNP